MKFILPGDPIAKARHRSFIANNRQIRTYDRQGSEKAFAITLIGHQMHELGYKMLNGPLSVDIQCHLNAKLGASEAISNLREWGYSDPPCKKPDLDNIYKFILDIGNNLIWQDDRQIVQLSGKKIYAKTPCTIITVTEIKEITMDKQIETFFKSFSPDDTRALLTHIEYLFVSTPSIHKDPKCDFYPEEAKEFAKKIINFSNQWSDKLKKVRDK
jgi:Holliday junction resolvase RusA-like endonuclease